jgi:hydrogenase nickel incorporation protein HypB
MVASETPTQQRRFIMPAIPIEGKAENVVATANVAPEQNRQLLHDAGIFTVSLFGGPGSGKTTLVDAAIERLAPGIRIGVVACDVFSHRDADRIARRSNQVVQVNTGNSGIVNPGHIRDALLRLDLNHLDLLFIENVGALTRAAFFDLGQDASAAVLSVAGGDDKADKHPDLIRAVDAILLNKTDLLRALPFNMAALRDDVRRINPTAPLFEVSTLHGEGLDPWIAWLRNNLESFQLKRHAAAHHDGAVSHWFG